MTVWENLYGVWGYEILLLLHGMGFLKNVITLVVTLIKHWLGKHETIKGYK